MDSRFGLGKLTKFQLSSTSGNIISRGLNFAIKHQCFTYKLKSGGRKFPPDIYLYGKDNVFYRKQQFSNGHKSSFIAPTDLKFYILT